MALKATEMLLAGDPPLLLLSLQLHIIEMVFVCQFYALLLVARGTGRDS